MTTRAAMLAIGAVALAAAAGDGARALDAAPRGAPWRAAAQDPLPRATLLYQNFPNPFPSATADRTCFWLDLHASGTVRLELFDIRGRPVRTFVPSDELPATLPAGRYGRGDASASPPGCDPRFAWDGTARDGRVVPAGIYLLRLSADGTTQIRKIVFRGR